MSSTPEDLLLQFEAAVRELEPEERLGLIERLSGVDDTHAADSPAVSPQQLQDALTAYQQRRELAPGTLVQWKSQLANKPVPGPGEPAIVVEVLDEPIVTEDEPVDSPYFRERLDVILGVIDADGDLLFFHYDSQRFEPFA
jgi:hypothetical protein